VAKEHALCYIPGMGWFMPRQDDFFELFESAAENSHAAACELVEMLEKFDDVAERAKRIKDLEHAGDKVTHAVIERLNRTFVTPMDRQDIHELICRVDDIVDLIDTAANRMVLYKIGRPTQDAIDLAHCLRHATQVIRETMPLLRDMKNSRRIGDMCIAIQTQENDADRLMQHAIAKLFEARPDPIEVIKWKDIYEEIESATDRCEDVANVLDSIVLKNA
jgi:predicted phosphate transport protein (TIGR00153 family)